MKYKFHTIEMLAQEFPDKIPDVEKLEFIMEDSNFFKISELNLISRGDLAIIQSFFKSASRHWECAVYWDTAVKVADSVQEIPIYFLEDTEVCQVNLTGVRSIGKGAFYNCTELSRVVFSDSLEEIGSLAFRHCTSLEEVCLGEGLKVIQMAAFAECKALSYIVIPDSTVDIHFNAFEGCASLKEVQLGRGVSELRSGVFVCAPVERLFVQGDIVAVDSGSGLPYGAHIFTDSVVSYETFKKCGYYYLYHLDKSPW